jgi:hypothetical protein
MKRRNIFSILIFTIVCTSCGFTRIGDLTMVSCRNIDSNTDYKLIKKYVEGTAKSNSGDALQAAINDAIKQVPDGEFLKNAVIYIKKNGKKVKVEGDVWGVPSIEKNVPKTVSEKVEFKIGDRIIFKNTFGKMIEGTILGLNQDTAIVEYLDNSGKEKKKEIDYEKLTKIKK